jgi:glucokinase
MPLEQRSSLALLADIGGTHARFALARGDDIGPIVTLQTAQYEGVEAAIRAFLEGALLSSPPQAAALACAGPVEDRHVQLTNSDWRIDADRICSELGFEDVILVNDFASVAWAVPFLKESDLHPIGDGKSVDGTPSVVLGPGTGLGVAGYLPRGGEDAVVVGEGGHVSMPSVTDREAEVLAAARHELGHVSAERLLSGDGLVRLYETLASLDRIEAPLRSASEITNAAAAQGCSLCCAAFDMFCDLLGTVAGNLALTFGARGGVYIAGGIVPKTRDTFAASRFRQRFEAKGRFRDYLAQIPTWIVIHPEPAFLGLMRVLRGTAPRS